MTSANASDMASQPASVPKKQGQELKQVDFVTLGMLILDDIEFKLQEPPVKDVLGGAGAFSALGARLFSPESLSKTVGWIVDKGSDFSPSLSAIIDSWGTSAVMRSNPDRLTTRGWNGYNGATERREFKYLTQKRRITADDLTPELLQSRSFHLICSPVRCQELVTDIKWLRKSAVPSDQYTKPIFIWEPVPDLCTPDELLNCTNTLPYVDVCSPNHIELAGFMGTDGLDPDTGQISTIAVESACEQLLASMPLQSYALVIRVGSRGCYIAKNGGRKRQARTLAPGRRKDYTRGGLQPDTDMSALFADLLRDDEGLVVREEIEIDPGIERWIPAYHQEKSKVIDPTGGGNAFLGALAVALARGERLENAATWGSVAASLAIEQIGMPILTKPKEGDIEKWNGEVVLDRLKEFQLRVS